MSDSNNCSQELMQKGDRLKTFSPIPRDRIDCCPQEVGSEGERVQMADIIPPSTKQKWLPNWINCSEMGDPILLPLQQVPFGSMDKSKHHCKEQDGHQLELPSIQTLGERILTMLFEIVEDDVVSIRLKTEFGF